MYCEGFTVVESVKNRHDGNVFERGKPASARMLPVKGVEIEGPNQQECH